ncbi:hypothetical protein CesoFtcFv8_005574 [Champsocephalus esox]|uniref:Uncharacterized protein n=1 Tax=Champsocephalus esox TaxID=159716 RepID=A0AAN8CST1_9TELE|nr:hypothetical protein CesoFtcFv8_005574 [Champsocephalus esox]
MPEEVWEGGGRREGREGGRRADSTREYKSHCRLLDKKLFLQDASCERLNVSSDPHDSSHEVPRSVLPPDPHLHAHESGTRLVWQLLPRLHYRHEGEREEEHRELQGAADRWGLQHQSCEDSLCQPERPLGPGPDSRRQQQGAELDHSKKRGEGRGDFTFLSAEASYITVGYASLDLVFPVLTEDVYVCTVHYNANIS